MDTFNDLTYDELIMVDGGIDWNLVGGTLATSGGAYIGSKIGGSVGSAGGPVGAVVGGLVGGVAGGVAGAIIYSLWD